MSYSAWTTYGYGVCVDDIKTTPKRLLKLAEYDPKVLEEIRNYLSEVYNERKYDDEELTMDDFDDLEGDYCERGISYVLYNVIKDKELKVCFADDYCGTPYILYCPTFPWYLKDGEKELSEENVKEIFTKYIKILTDEPVTIDYYNVENGG